MPNIQKRLSDHYRLDIPASTLSLKLKDQLHAHTPWPLPQRHTPKLIGIDEFSYAKGHVYAPFLVDLERHKILDLVAGGKTTAAAKALFNSIDCSAVLACAMDLWFPYKTACLQKLPNAVVVADKFHLVKHLNDAIQHVRKRITPQLPPENQAFCWEHRFVPLFGKERLSPHNKTILPTLLNLHPDLAQSYRLKEQFRNLYLLHQPDPVHSKLWEWINDARRSLLPEFVSIANTFASDWITEILNYWRFPISNAITEGKVNKIRVIQRKAYHYTSFANLRAQILKEES